MGFSGAMWGFAASSWSVSGTMGFYRSLVGRASVMWVDVASMRTVVACVWALQVLCVILHSLLRLFQVPDGMRRHYECC